ncbi:MAG TPA: hypothetical protein VHQ87_06430, partial [Rhizobacter sp.]|nr:hypothetical protein [Rhizobacter sp.]
TAAAQRMAPADAELSPQAAAQRAAASAARTHAPGLLASPAPSTRPTGTWFRRGRHLIVLNP